MDYAKSQGTHETRDPSNWPPEMQEQFKNEVEAAREHQTRHKDAFRKVRQAIDDFNPDAIVMFGDDQHENFKEDVIPPFCVFCMDEITSQPFHDENI